MSIVRRSERIEKVPARSVWIVANPDITPVLGNFRVGGNPLPQHSDLPETTFRRGNMHNPTSNGCITSELSNSPEMHMPRLAMVTVAALV